MRPIFLSFALLAAVSASAHAAATYSQSFDNVAGGIPALTSQGWIFRDQSSAKGQGWWATQWTVEAGWAGAPSESGAGHLAFLGQSSIQAPTNASAWAILPQVAGLANGDVLSYFVRFQSYPQYANAVLELRYAANGQSGTGTNATSVGDFTTLLQTVPVSTGTLYANFKAVIPGSGRIAFRMVHPNLPMFGVSASLQIDTVQFNPPPPPFPLPAPGQTVTWTAAMSPIQVVTDFTIPAGGTVLVDPGVEIRVADGKIVEILGELHSLGTAASPVTFKQLGLAGELRPGKGGTLDLSHAVVDLRTHALNGATILASNTTFLAKGGLVNAFDAQLDPAHTVLRLDDCVFQGSSLQMNNLTAALRHVAFQGLAMNDDVLALGYVLLDDVSVNGTALWLGKDHGVQPVYVDGVTVRNSPQHGGLYLYRGTNFQLGPNNVLANNLWPVEFGTSCAGLMPGSVVPTSGNTNNFVIDTDDFDPQTTVTWAPLAVPYVVRMTRFLGYQTILPGAHIQFMPGAGWESEFAGGLDACGTEDQPIVFERFDPGMQWDSIRMFKPTHGQRMEHCIFRGAKRAVTSDDVQFDACRFENCLEGIYTNAYALARKCEFVSNAVAINAYNPTIGFDGAVLLNSASNPNSFTGNALAVRASVGDYPNAAQNNWWGHATGPFHPTQNPQGQGDPIDTTFASLPFKPFLTSAPDFTDSPPHVVWRDGRIVVAEPGTTLLLSWTAADDGAVASQRVLFSSNSNAPGQMTPLATPIAANQRTFAFTVPSVGIQQNGVSAFLRIESTDDHGQIGLDDLELYITEPNLQGDATLVENPAGLTFAPGDHLDIAYTLSNLGPNSPPSISASLFLDNDRTAVGLGGAGIGQPIPLGLSMPEVSTDRARIALIFGASLNQQKIFFSEPFSIRPSVVLGDAPPAVALSAPLANESFLAGTTLPLRWEAVDDEGLRAFDIRISTDGGRRWNEVVRDLPGTARAYDWPLPANVALDDVRVRVIAHDVRYQNTAADVQVRIVAGTACQANAGFGSPGGPLLSICGAPLSSGQFATLTLSGAPSAQPGLLLVSTSFNPTPAFGGLVVPVPAPIVIPILTGTGGQLSIAPVPGGNGPLTFYVQAVVADPTSAFGATASNTVGVALLP